MVELLSKTAHRKNLGQWDQLVYLFNIMSFKKLKIFAISTLDTSVKIIALKKIIQIDDIKI